MIPLQPLVPVKIFPKSILIFCCLLLLVNFYQIFLDASRLEHLQLIAFVPAVGLRWSSILSVFFFPHLFSLLIGILFIWVFAPRVEERRGRIFMIVCGGLSALLTATTYRLIFPSHEAPVLLTDSMIGAWLGAYMRRDIWGTVNTLVLGPGWIRVLEVPSYVQLFFWFFYQLISNLMMPEIFANTPMPYFIGFSGFLFGFGFDSLWGFRKNEN